MPLARILLAGGLLALAGCRGGTPPHPPSAEASPKLHLAAPDRPAAGEGAVRYEVSEAVLDRFVAYQEQTLALYEDPGASLRQLELHALAQQRAQEQHRLTARDVLELERVVGDVISRRSLAQERGGDEALAQLEALAARLQPLQREALEPTIEQLRQQRAENSRLTVERERHGDRNVDLVLAREEVLTRQWNQAVALFLGGKDAGSR